MQFTTRAIDPTQPFPLQVRLELLTRIVPATTIDAVFAELGLPVRACASSRFNCWSGW